MVANGLRTYIAELSFVDENELTDDQPLFSAGIIDSISLLSLVEWVEKQASIKVSPGQLTLENWDSIERINRFIERTQQA